MTEGFTLTRVALQVRIWRTGESLRNAKDYDCGRRTWIMVDDNFEKNDFYNLRVFGYSRGGVGKMSSPLIQFTIGRFRAMLRSIVYYVHFSNTMSFTCPCYIVHY